MNAKAKDILQKFLLGIVGVLFAAVVFIALVPIFVKARVTSAPITCPSNLRILEGTVITWQLEHPQLSNAVPAWSEIVGPKFYLQEMPVCPQGGVYTLHTASQKPTCSINSHTL